MNGWGFDCLGSQVHLLEGVRPTAIWPYLTGPGIAWSNEQINHWAQLPRRPQIYRVNQGATQGPGEALHGDEFDLERGAWTRPALLEVIRARRQVQWSTRVYCSWADYGALKQDLAEAGMGQSVWFRIADWNIDQHFADFELHGDVYAGQWASPQSNPGTKIPGTNLTLAEANADLSVVLMEYTGWEG